MNLKLVEYSNSKSFFYLVPAKTLKFSIAEPILNVNQSHHDNFKDMKSSALDLDVWLSLKSCKPYKIQHSSSNC